MKRTCLWPWFGCFVLVIAGWCMTVQGADNERPLVFGVNRVGNPEVIFNPPDYDEQMYKRIREAGGTCVRILASPRDIEPTRGLRHWGDFDKDLGLALKYDQEPIVLIANIPAWASPTGEATHAYPYKTEMLPDFASFCTELARRTKGKAKYFQLWNEQNGCGWHCQDGFNLADEYFPMLTTCYKALKEGNPECTLSLGSLDDAEGHAPIFLRKTYEEMAKHNVTGPVFDVVSDHPYSENPKIMRGKLDALRAILKAHGDGEMPFWITEYGWHTGNTPLKDQASKLAETLAAFTQPSWNDLQAAVYLCIADFEGTMDGFGLMDVNLRPRPAYYAFQAASRFGAYPPYRIEPVFTAADRLVIRWKTLKPTSGKVTLTPGDDSTMKPRRHSPSGTEHKVEFEGIKPGKVYRYEIETTSAAAGSSKSIRSAVYEVRAPSLQVDNGDFEDGFFAGIGNGWRIDGRVFCTDASLMPRAREMHGDHAQAVFVSGDHPLECTLSTIVAAAPGKTLDVAFSWAGRRTVASGNISARAGIAIKGGSNADGDDITWIDWQDVKIFAEEQKMSATPANSVVTLFFQCRSEQPVGNGQARFVLDHVRVVEP